MKKTFTLFLCVLLIAALTACNTNTQNDPRETSDPENKQTQNESEASNDKTTSSKLPDGAIVLSGEDGCRIVYGEDCWNAASKIFDAIFELDERSYKQIGFYDVSSDSKAKDAKIEIVIGKTNREASIAASSKVSTYLDYSVSIENGSVAIFSHSPTRTVEAAEHFISCLEFTNGQLIYIPSKDTDIGKHTTYPAADIKVADKELSAFTLIHPVKATAEELTSIKYMIDWIGTNTGAIIDVKDDSSQPSSNEILVGKTNRKTSMDIYSTLSAGKYVFEVKSENDSTDVIMAYGNAFAMSKLFEEISSTIEATGAVPQKIEGEIKEENMIVSTIPALRDPCIVVHDGTYYAYGTGWVAYKNTSGQLGGEWKSLGRVVTVPEDAIDNYWAPEVHKYNGEFYMFTTYKSAKTGHRGCSIFRSSTPEGPFVEISNGHATPADWDSIDATLYIDEEGQPWMIFVHEWTSTDDGIGRMAAAKMSADLTELVSEPIELFRADDSSWTNRQVTDGCWLYKCENGELIMIWSNFAADGYCVGIARSDNGRIDGNWSQDDTLLYSKTMQGEYDGGHGMIFTSLNGQMYLSIHSPNNASDGRSETPVFIAIREQNGTLVWAE